MYTLYLQTKIGLVEIITTDNEVIKLDIVKVRGLNENINSFILEVKKEVTKYFQGNLTQFKVPFKISGSEFNQKVLNEIANIKYAQNKTYKEIAINIGNEKAYRAVGNVCNKNPIPIIIPCHRVISSNINGGGYRYGLDIKKKLYLLEKGEITLI